MVTGALIPLKFSMEMRVMPVWGFCRRPEAQRNELHRQRIDVSESCPAKGHEPDAVS